ncbi:hypothetical protein [Desulfovibrio sp.]|uniref:hypothetical protein n=1 Tax=Desulfovibrio sp. TaxID=885 RepID=UPI0025C11B5D|nr:hypothetical protein [Desulfovibrio sp.]
MPARAMTSLFSAPVRKPTAVRALLCMLALALCGCQFPFGAKRAVAPEPVAPPQPACVVLALPASGPYAAIATKIKRGAEAARQELTGAGAALRLETVNTEAPDWLTTLAALPPSCAVVGGPLRDAAYVQAQKAGALEQRAFFAFVPNLKSGEEGARAWRFFPSPQDQVDALVAFATDDLGIRSYGTFHPGDAYATRMTGILAQNLAKRHIPLRQASYNAADPTSWSDAAQPLINPVVAEGSSTPVPQTEFEALFLPDSWKNVDMITQSLLYNGEDRLVLLGTTLWEQGLSGRQVPRAENFALAVFPGAWNAQHAPGALKGQGHDFWTALGYDFVNFATALALESRLSTPQITAMAQRAATAVRGMAPLTYDDAGVAHQKLYLFQVSPSGMKPLDAAQFRDTRAAVLERAALRMQGLPSVDAQGNPLVPGAPGAPATPALTTGEPGALPAATPVAAPAATPGAPVLDTTPRPSYKLRLPGSR